MRQALPWPQDSCCSELLDTGALLPGEGAEELSLRRAEQWVLLALGWLPEEHLMQGRN